MKTSTRARSTILSGWLMAAAVSGMASAAYAHHSFAMFDNTKRVTVTGAVKEFQWSNPHVFIELMVPQPDGKTRQYSIECSSISVLRRVGWSPSHLKPGDKITVELFPLRDGRPGGLMDKVTLADGRSFGNANGGVLPATPPPAGKSPGQ